MKGCFFTRFLPSFLQLLYRMATLSALLSDMLGLAEPSARFLLALFSGEFEFFWRGLGCMDDCMVVHVCNCICVWNYAVIQVAQSSMASRNMNANCPYLGGAVPTIWKNSALMVQCSSQLSDGKFHCILCPIIQSTCSQFLLVCLFGTH